MTIPQIAFFHRLENSMKKIFVNEPIALLSVTQTRDEGSRSTPGLRRGKLSMFVLTFLDFWLICVNFKEARSRLYRSRCLQVNTRFKPLDEIYKIYTLLDRSEFKNSTKRRRTFSHSCSFSFKLSLIFCNCFPNCTQFWWKISWRSAIFTQDIKIIKILLKSPEISKIVFLIFRISKWFSTSHTKVRKKLDIRKNLF